MRNVRVALPLAGGGTPEIVSLDAHFGGERQGHFALIFGDRVGPEDVLVRIHSECVTGDVLGSLRCDCGLQLQEALSSLTNQGGVLIYLRQEGRGIGLHDKLRAYMLQDSGMDTFQANQELGHSPDARLYDVAATFLKTMGVASVRLLTRNPEKADALSRLGVTVNEVLPTGLYMNRHNERYLRAKELRAAQASRAGPRNESNNP